MHRARRLVVWLVVAGVSVSACDSGGTKAAPTSTTGVATSSGAPTGAVGGSAAPSKFATLYLEILGPADAASGTFFTALEKLPASASGVDAQRIATPAADAIALADRKIGRIRWPARVAAEMRALVVADERVVRDLRTVGAQARLGSGPWKPRFERDVTAVTGRVKTVVADLQALPA